MENKKDNKKVDKKVVVGEVVADNGQIKLTECNISKKDGTVTCLIQTDQFDEMRKDKIQPERLVFQLVEPKEDQPKEDQD